MLEVALTPTPKITQGGVTVQTTDPESEDPQALVTVYEVDLPNAARILKQAAEELGQLPNRVTLTGDALNPVTTVYRIEGVSDSDLL